MRLGYHYHVPAVKMDGSIFVPGYIGKFIESLALNCESVTCFMHDPLPNEIEYMDYCIKSTNVQLVSIGKHTKVYYRVILWMYFVRKIYKKHHEVDIMLIRGPSPLLPYVAKVIGETPIALLLVGDFLNGIKDLAQPWFRKKIIHLLHFWNKKQQVKLAKQSLVVAYSHILYKEYEHIALKITENVSTTLSDSDFIIKDDTCNDPTIQLLYTGRIEKSKGLFEMFEAVSLLSEKGIEICLNLVGLHGKNDTILDDLFQFSKTKGIDKKVVYHGYVPHGPDLFDHYRKADIYIIASTHEGFPRTIWEAMAHSLPVIATKVGGIPHKLSDGDNAILIEPSDSAVLADAIIKVVRDKQLRQKLIKTGRDLASQNTLEIQSRKLIDELERFLKEQNDKL